MRASRAERRDWERGLCGFSNPYERDVYVYNLWHFWRKQDGQDMEQAPPPEAAERFVQAALGGFEVREGDKVWSARRLAPHVRDATAWHKRLALARSWLEPDYSVPPLEEFLRQHGYEPKP